jgi:hypothetical protein
MIAPVIGLVLFCIGLKIIDKSTLEYNYTTAGAMTSALGILTFLAGCILG